MGREGELLVLPQASNYVWVEVDDLTLYIRSIGEPGNPCLEISHDGDAEVEKCKIHKYCQKLKLKKRDDE